MEKSTPSALEDDYLTRAQVADLLKLNVQTLERWAMQNRGPNFLKLAGKAVRYRRSDVEAWLAAQSTSH